MNPLDIQQPSSKKNVQSDSELGNWHISGQLDGTGEIRRIEIYSTPFRVGRRSGLHLSLPGGSVSKEHAELIVDNGRLFVRDLGSTNGTYVNGSQIQTEIEVTEGDLVQFASLVFRIGRDENYAESHTQHEDACDRALVMMQFDRLISDGGVIPYFQPIITIEDQKTIGYEVLGRSRLFGLKTPSEMFSAAARLNLEVELSQLMRQKGIHQARQLPYENNIFVNTHPLELTNENQLYRSLEQLRADCPSHTITLEIHEAAVTDARQIHELRKVLDNLNMNLAFDDFGAGRARLVELSECRPDFVKFDMRLTRDIHRATAKRQEVVGLIVKMVNDLGIISLAEGIENEATHEILKQMNFKMGQGFYYGRPESIVTYLSDTDTDHQFGK